METLFCLTFSDERSNDDIEKGIGMGKIGEMLGENPNCNKREEQPKKYKELEK